MPTLNWIGKDKVVNHHNEVPFRVLEKQYTFGDTPDSGNMIIHGDNLEVLKALLPKYEGKVKCIYIDPPYNTGEEKWVYNDNVNDPRIKKWLGQVVGKEADDLTRHDKWLCMMYPRLKLLQKLLANDGAIFISIDDNEQANLKLICDEIFGIKNFVGEIIHQRAKGGGQAKHIVKGHDYILVYGKDSKYLKLARKKVVQGKTIVIDGVTYIKNDDVIRKTFGKYDSSQGDRRCFYEQLEQYKGKAKKEEVDRLIREGKYFLELNSEGMHTICELQKVDDATSKLYSIIKVLSEEGKNELEKLGLTEFSYPKPTEIVRQLIEAVRTSDDEDFIVLDSFGGSGTTANAVLIQNKQDGGNRKFILCEMCDYAETITAERVRRVMKGYGEGKNAVEGTGGSFDFYELGTTIFDNKTELLNDDADTEQIRQYVWYAETHTAYMADQNRSNPYLLGTHNFTDYYFYYEPKQETVLDWNFLQTLKQRAEQYIIYADRCLLAQEEMQLMNIVFKKIPRDIKRL